MFEGIEEFLSLLNSNEPLIFTEKLFKKETVHDGFITHESLDEEEVAKSLYFLTARNYAVCRFLGCDLKEIVDAFYENGQDKIAKKGMTTVFPIKFFDED